MILFFPILSKLRAKLATLNKRVYNNKLVNKSYTCGIRATNLGETPLRGIKRQIATTSLAEHRCNKAVNRRRLPCIV